MSNCRVTTKIIVLVIVSCLSYATFEIERIRISFSSFAEYYKNATFHKQGYNNGDNNNNKSHNNDHRLLLSVLRSGRLGNAMWEYSALLGLANLTDRIPILNPGFRDLKNIFNLSVPLDNREQRFKHFHRYVEPNSKFKFNTERTVNKLKNISEDVMLNGYFQYYRFFSHISDKIRKEFTFRKEIQRKVSSFFNRESLTDKNIVKVGIHIRRADMTSASRIKKGFGSPGESYFSNAMKYFRSKYKKIHFFVCSDDLRWARKHISGDDVTFVEHQAAAVDMAIMASCDHVIISNGTFSWWIGWLCKGTTVRYKRIPKRYTYLYNLTGDEYWPPDDAFNHYVAIDSEQEKEG